MPPRFAVLQPFCSVTGWARHQYRTLKVGSQYTGNSKAAGRCSSAGGSELENLLLCVPQVLEHAGQRALALVRELVAADGLQGGRAATCGVSPTTHNTQHRATSKDCRCVPSCLQGRLPVHATQAAAAAVKPGPCVCAHGGGPASSPRRSSLIPRPGAMPSSSGADHRPTPGSRAPEGASTAAAGPW